MKTTRIGNLSKTFMADEANTLYSMAADKTIVSQGFGIEIHGHAKNREFVINGKIDSGDDSVSIGLAGSDASSVDLAIGTKGHLISKTDGIEAHGAGHVITNAGTIEVVDDGIAAYDSTKIVNTGSISGHTGINLYLGEGDSVSIVNAGSITGEQYSIYASTYRDRIVNSGDLTGDVYLGDGKDIFTFKGGMIDGVVRGGADNDTFIARADGLDIFEESGQGTDTVRSTVSFSLQSNVENLYLLGKANRDGIGNEGENTLHGNAGKNYLNAGDGADVLDGGKGNDILQGGVGSDEFHFQKGTGRDIVNDYEAGLDEIHILNPGADASFDDMIQNHTEEKFGDVVITYGKDVIVLKDHAIADLHYDDFSFYQ